MNDEIHAARFVTKTHTTNVATFASPLSGTMGLLTKRQIIYFYDLPQREVLPDVDINKNIPVLKAYAGMDGQLLKILADANIDGIIIEALGAGNLSREAARGDAEDAHTDSRDQHWSSRGAAQHNAHLHVGHTCRNNPVANARTKSWQEHIRYQRHEHLISQWCLLFLEVETRDAECGWHE